MSLCVSKGWLCGQELSRTKTTGKKVSIEATRSPRITGYPEQDPWGPEFPIWDDLHKTRTQENRKSIQTWLLSQFEWQWMKNQKVSPGNLMSTGFFGLEPESVLSTWASIHKPKIVINVSGPRSVVLTGTWRKQVPVLLMYKLDWQLAYPQTPAKCPQCVRRKESSI